ncbi:hypothetical protein ACN2CC_10950 [Mesorhizobium muleiense]|uniref:hypothetical protein n=1 Tax=Mesorhizobium muleiense TaxID=1004279 RepID=UPI003AFAEDBD
MRDQLLVLRTVDPGSHGYGRRKTQTAARPRGSFAGPGRGHCRRGNPYDDAKVESTAMLKVEAKYPDGRELSADVAETSPIVGAFTQHSIHSAPCSSSN